MNEKVVMIHQPDFIPYLGFFHRLMLSDIYIVLDNVQFTRGGSNCWTNRDKIKTPQGAKWITISCKKAPVETDINQIELNDALDWRSRNLSQIKDNYSDAPGFREVFPHIENLYGREYTLLSDFTFASIQVLIELFAIDIEILFSSDLKPCGKSNQRVIDLVKKTGAHKYLSGVGARSYFEPELYRRAGINVLWQDFKHPVYPQLYGDFIPYLSSIDLLLNCGIEESRKILRSTI